MPYGYILYKTWIHRVGALIKISDGQNFNYLEKIDITNTYNLKKP